MVIDLIFSQSNIAFYYYENEKGYTLADYNAQVGNGAAGGGAGGDASFYYDDGLYFAGYIDSDSTSGAGGAGGSGMNLGSSLGSGSSNSSNNGSANGNSSNFSSGTIDQSALRG